MSDFQKTTLYNPHKIPLCIGKILQKWHQRAINQIHLKKYPKTDIYGLLENCSKFVFTDGLKLNILKFRQKSLRLVSSRANLKWPFIRLSRIRQNKINFLIGPKISLPNTARNRGRSSGWKNTTEKIPHPLKLLAQRRFSKTSLLKFYH